jgi:hypothetical protein
LYSFSKNICLCGKGDNSNLNIDTMNWITDKYASKIPLPNSGFREKNFKNQPIRNKNRLWLPCLLMDWDGMNNLYRGPSIECFLPSLSSFD